MDAETGELSVADQETGETPASPITNEETGEREMNVKMPRMKRKFKIPQQCLAVKKPRKEYLLESTGTNMSSTVLFLMPTIYFAPIVAVVIVALEVVLHIYAHKKNKKSKSEEFFYQSPLHPFISEFCAACKDENSKNKITKIQDKMNYKLTKYGTGCFRIVT